MRLNYLLIYLKILSSFFSSQLHWRAYFISKLTIFPCFGQSFAKPLGIALSSDFKWGFASSFSFLSSLQCFSLKLLGWWSHTDSINYWYLHSEMDHRLIHHSEWEGAHKLMPPYMLCFDVFCFAFLKILFYFGVAICFS